MIGKRATLEDIVLQEQPEPVSLTCYEHLDEEEPITTRPYKISLHCVDCSRMLRIAVRCTSGGIQALQSLLLQDIFIVCSPCALHQR
uniref:Protein E7 n=1 Tax=Mops bat papillomavirus TaxID=3141892 RepID=A0AAU7E342_9PAPI